MAAVFALSTGNAIAQDTGKAAYQAYVDGLEKLGIEINFGAVDYDADSDTLTISDSTYTFSGKIEDLHTEKTDTDPGKKTDLAYSFSVFAGTETLTGMTLEDSAFFAENWSFSDDTSLVMEGTADDIGHFKFETRLIGSEATNYKFFFPEFPAEDPNHAVSRWLPFVRTLMQASYDEFNADQLGLTFEAYGTTDGKDTLIAAVTSQADGYRLTGGRDGMIAEYAINSLTQTIDTPGPSNGERLIQTTQQGKTVYQDINIAAFLDLFDPAVPETGDAVTLFGSGSMVDYRSEQEIAPGQLMTMTGDRATLDDLSVIKRDNKLISIFDELLNDKDPVPEDFFMGIFQLYRSFALTDARISGISIHVPTPEPVKDLNVSIREIAMTDVSSNGIGEMMIVGFDIPDLPDGAYVKLDWAAIGDIEFADFAPMSSMIKKLVADPNYGEDHPLELARAFLPWSLGYEVEGLDMNLPDVGRTQIGKAEMSVSTTVAPVPTSFYLKNDDIRFPVSLIEERDVQALFQALGLEEVVWSDETRFHWDEETLELRLERLMLNIEGIGNVEVTARFANVPRALFEDPEGQGQIAAIMAQFVDASLTFKDSGLATKGLAHFAEAQNIPENVLREVLAAEAAKATAVIQNVAFTNMVSDAVSTFLENPGELKVSLTPSQPVPMAQILGSLAAPQTLPDILNVEIVAN